ncbi:MAG: hypothetical protein J3Q66DRAFT_386538 [Benniella sp.]|nr:MAG: hypothetical protein J3Q66DRAFT_386538 [Benniella sp.]
MKFHLVTLSWTLLAGALNTVNAAIPKPPPRPLSDLGINHGSVVALRNNWPYVLAKGKGYLSLCNQCGWSENIATHHGNSNTNGWSQFIVGFLEQDAQGYQIVKLQSVHNGWLLSVCTFNCPNGLLAGKYEFVRPDVAPPPATKWRAMPVDMNGRRYLTLANVYHNQNGKLCEGCLPGNLDHFIVSADSAETSFQSYHLYTVEKLRG